MLIAFKVSKHFRRSLQTRYSNKFIGTWCILSVWRSLCFKSCLSAVRIWCTTLSQDPQKTSQKNGAFLLQECEERAVSAIFGPAGLSGRCKRLMSHGETRRTSIHVTAGCLHQTANGIKRHQAWCTWQATLRDNGRVCRGVDKYGHLNKDERVLVLVKCLSHVLHAWNAHFLPVWARISKEKESRCSHSLFN